MKKIFFILCFLFLPSPSHAFPQGGRESIAPYLGPVATAAMVPQTLMASGSAMTRKCHISRDTIHSVQLAYPNWWISVITGGGLLGGEAATGNNIAINAWVEYPVGVYTQALFSSATTGIISNGTTGLSDVVSVNIPNGATFYTWTHVTGSGGNNFPYYTTSTVGNPLFTTIGEASNFGVSPPASPGAISDNFSGRRGYWPAAILGQTSKPTFFIIGDSRTAGVDEVANSSCDLGDVARSVGPSYAYINDGIGGQRAASWFNSSTNQMALSQYASNVIDQLGYNEFNQQTASFAVAQAYKRDISARFNGRKYIRTTIEPWTSSSDNWSSLGGQTLNGETTNMNSFNDWVRTPGDGVNYGEISNAVSTAQDSGFWVTNGTAKYATVDGIHPSTAGSLLISAAGGINPTTISAYSPISTSYSSINLTSGGSPVFTNPGPFAGVQSMSGGNGSIVGVAPGGAPMTQECWAKTSSSSAAAIIGEAPITIQVNPNLQMRLGSGTTVSSSTSISDGNWHHVAVTYSNSLYTLYADGVSVATSVTAVTSAQWGNNGLLVVGASAPFGSIANQWTGSVAECALWNYLKYTGSFTPPVAPYTGTESGLVALWHLNGNLNGIRGPAGM